MGPLADCFAVSLVHSLTSEVACSYVTMRLLGISADDPCLARTRSWVRPFVFPHRRALISQLESARAMCRTAMQWLPWRLMRLCEMLWQQEHALDILHVWTTSHGLTH